MGEWVRQWCVMGRCVGGGYLSGRVGGSVGEARALSSVCLNFLSYNIFF